MNTKRKLYATIRAMALGIDFGTTHSVMAHYKDGKAEIIPSSEGERLTHSTFDPTSLVVGHGGIRSIKRLLGRTLEENRYFSHPVREEGDGTLRVMWQDQPYPPEEIAAAILAKMRLDAEKYLGEKIDEAVITVPAYYDNAQRQATKTAAEIAGIRVLRLLNEPTAAALAYGIDEGDETLLVVDLGGGTLDVSLLSLHEGLFEVLATHGDSLLGGDDFTRVLRSLLPYDAFPDEEQFLRIVEEAKHDLSGVLQTNISFISNSGVSVQETISRDDFEKEAASLLERILAPVEVVLKAAGVDREEVTKLLFVGGTTRMPAVRDAVESFLGIKAVGGVNPEEVVALGAALQASIILGSQDDVLLIDVLPLSLGVETHDGRMSVLLSSNTTIPAQETEIFTTAEDNQASVEINILQGESLLAEGNKHLAKLRLLGIPPTIAGVPQVEVGFSFDADGILHVAARDLATGGEQKMSLVGMTALDEDEVLLLKKKAQETRDVELSVSLKRSQKAQAERLLSVGRKLLQIDGLPDNTYLKLQEELSSLEDEIEDDDIQSIERVVSVIRLIEEEFRKRYPDSDQEEQ